MVKNFLQNSRMMLSARQTDILSAATIIAATLLLSRVLGLLKYRLLNDHFTVSEMGLFFAAFRLPNAIFDLVVMGALTTAFIPVFTALLNKGEKDEANTVASTVLNLSTIVLTALAVLLVVFADPIISAITPGLTAGEIDLVVAFTRIMLIGQAIPLAIGNFLTGILQSSKRFLIPALAPVFYNLGIIGGVFFLAPNVGLYGAIWGVVIGAILFTLLQIPFALETGFRFRPVVNLHHEAVKTVGRLTLPRIIGLAVSQLNSTVNLSLSSLISSRAITVFNYAQQLQQLPVSIFGATIAQAALPTLSEEQAQKDRESFTRTFLSSFLQILFLTLPAAAVLIVLRIPIVRLVYGASKFDWPATVETGRTLAFFGLALVSESLINLLVRSYFALKIPATPMLLGIVGTVFNITLSVLFIHFLHLPVWGLAASTAGADILYSAMLLFFLNRRLHFLSIQNLFLPAGKMILAALIALLSLYLPLKLLDQLVFDTTRTLPLLMLTGTASIIGLSVYLFVTWLLNIRELESFLGLLRRLSRLFFKAEETVSEVVTSQPLPISETTPEKN